MEHPQGMHYIELTEKFISFDTSQLTSAFYDDARNELLVIHSGSGTGVAADDTECTHCTSDRPEEILFAKLSPDKKILAMQRQENVLELVCFQGEPPKLQISILHPIKSPIFGFFWVHNRELALISSTGVEIFQILPKKRQVRSVKALRISILWFIWCCVANVALLCTEEGENADALVPVLVQQKIITKLPKVNLGRYECELEKSMVTMVHVYGVLAILILNEDTFGFMEVEVHLLNQPGLAPRKCHVLRLKLPASQSGFNISNVDNLIVVHHQATEKSLLFDIALSGFQINDVTYHIPIAPGRSIKPFALKLPSPSPDGQTKQCKLYSKYWLLYQPNIVIDAELCVMWHLKLDLETLCSLVSDRAILTEFLLNRCGGKQVLLKMVQQLIDERFEGTMLPVLETIFDKINKIYASWVQNQRPQPSNVTTSVIKHAALPTVLIVQSDMVQILQTISERPYTESILLLYLQSLNNYNISAQKMLSRLIASELIHNQSFDTLRRLVSYSMLQESKSMACFLLAHSDGNTAVYQVAMDMLVKLKAHDTIIKVMLDQGRVVDALHLAEYSLGISKVPTRKFLEAALKTNDQLIFSSVYRFSELQLEHLRDAGIAKIPLEHTL